MNKKVFDVLIIGAGQSGLVIAYYLREKKLTFLIVDDNKRVGDSWRKRYDSLKLLTQRMRDSLTGFRLSGIPNDYPTKDEIADYLESYAKHFSLPVKLKTKIIKLKKKDDLFLAESVEEVYLARNVVVATGPFQKPYIPKNLGDIGKDIFQIHSAFYKNPSKIPKRKVLVVGGGHSGIQIAAELSKTRKVSLSTKTRFIIGNKFDFLYWIAVRILPARLIQKIVEFFSLMKIHVPETEEILKSGRIELKRGLSKIKGKTFLFKDGSSDRFESVIWATGFIYDFSWIDINDLFDKRGLPVNKNGESVIPGLYFVYADKDYGFIYDLPKRAERLIHLLLLRLLQRS